MEEVPARWPGDDRRTDAPATRDEVVPATWDDVVGRPGDTSDSPSPADADTSLSRWGREPVYRVPHFATWRRRAAGFLIDFAIAWAVPLALVIAVSVDDPGSQGTNPSTAADVLVLATVVAVVAGLVVYPVWFLGHRGQTPGMKRMHLRLYRYESPIALKKPTYHDVWFRLGAWFCCMILLYVGPLADYVVAPLVDRRNRCLHDMAVKTVVLDERER